MMPNKEFHMSVNTRRKVARKLPVFMLKFKKVIQMWFYSLGPALTASLRRLWRGGGQEMAN